MITPVNNRYYSPVDNYQVYNYNVKRACMVQSHSLAWKDISYILINLIWLMINHLQNHRPNFSVLIFLFEVEDFFNV